MALYSFKPKFVGNTFTEKIQDTPLYHLDWAVTDTVEIDSWRGIIDMENFDQEAPAVSLGTPTIMKIKGPQIASVREQFYIQITPYYDTSADAALPYVIPVTVGNGVSDIAIFNMKSGGDFDAPFYLYFELGVNYAGK